MSEAQSSSNVSNRTIDKRVQVIAYLSDQSYDDWREYVNGHDEDTDYFEKETKTRTKYYLTGMGEEIKIDEEQYEKFSQNNIGRLSLRKDVDEREKFAISPVSYIKDIGVVAIESLINDVEGFDNGSFWRHRIEHEDSDCEIRLITSTRVLGMLKHPSEATAEDLFENNEDLMAMEFKFKISDATEDLVDTIDESIIKEFIKTISKSDEIEKVRIYDCEIDTSEKGACINI